jgi:Fungal protein kinase
VGFDPVIGPEAQLRENMERQYEFEVHDNHDDPGDSSPDRKRIKKYRSVKCIANYGRVGIRGRGTSIYSVRPSDDENAPLQVLKDSWIDIDRLTEGRVLEDVHAALHSDTEYQPYLRHLLTPDYYGFVPNDAGVRMETVSLSSWDNESSSRHSLVPNDGGRKRKWDWIQGGTPQAEVGDHSAKIGLRGDARKRCRTVFVEGPGKELVGLETLSEVFTAIKGGLNGACLYIRGFVGLKSEIQLYWRCIALAISTVILVPGTLSSFRGKAMNLATMKMLAR